MRSPWATPGDPRMSEPPAVPTPQCRACNNGAHMDCFGCGCACNAPEPEPQTYPSTCPACRGTGGLGAYNDCPACDGNSVV